MQVPRIIGCTEHFEDAGHSRAGRAFEADLRPLAERITPGGNRREGYAGYSISLIQLLEDGDPAGAAV